MEFYENSYNRLLYNKFIEIMCAKYLNEKKLKSNSTCAKFC